MCVCIYVPGIRGWIGADRRRGGERIWGGLGMGQTYPRILPNTRIFFLKKNSVSTPIPEKIPESPIHSGRVTDRILTGRPRWPSLLVPTQLGEPYTTCNGYRTRQTESKYIGKENKLHFWQSTRPTQHLAFWSFQGKIKPKDGGSNAI